MPKQLSTVNIAIENVKRRPFRSMGLGLIVAAFAFAIFAGSFLAESISAGIVSLSGRLGADILIVPYGYERKLEGALLRGEPSTFYLKAELEEKIRGIEGVEKVAPQLFLATLNSYCCSYPVQLIGYAPEEDFVIAPWLSAQMKASLKEGEIIVGDKLTGQPGDGITLFGHTHRVVGRLEPTGMGFDTSAFMNMDSARKLLKISGIAPEDLEMDFISSIMIKVQDGYEVKYIANLLMQKFAMDYNLDVVVTKNMMTDISSKLKGISLIIYGIAALLWLVAFGVLAVVFSMILGERKREFALLRVMGATKAKVAGIILCESAVISTIGAIAGIIAACTVIFPFNAYISNEISLPYLQPKLGIIIGLLAAGFALAALVGPLACLASALRIYRADISITMRSGE